MAHPKGERLKVGFDGSLRFEFHGAKVNGVWGGRGQLTLEVCEAHPRFFELPHPDPFRGSTEIIFD